MRVSQNENLFVKKKIAEENSAGHQTKKAQTPAHTCRGGNGSDMAWMVSILISVFIFLEQI
jgi:hypothetical protein